MRIESFDETQRKIFDNYERLVARPNEPEDRTNGVSSAGATRMQKLTPLIAPGWSRPLA